MTEYDPEIYWSRVGQEIQKRGENYVAGDDNPYYRYKRKKFLRKFLDTIDFQNKVILEIGFGPGGNLKHLAKYHKCKKILGADISKVMFEIARQNLNNYKDVVELRKINGKELPFQDQSVDVSFTVTVLQHITDKNMFKRLVQEMCRVTKSEIVIIEDIGINQQLGDEGSWIGRQVDVYKSIFSEYGFRLFNLEFLNTRISRVWYKTIYELYRRFINNQHKEGDPINFIFRYFMGIPVIFTRYFDDIFVEKKNLAKMIFHRI